MSTGAPNSVRDDRVVDHGLALPDSFEGRVAVITGASGGLGAGIASRLADLGFSLGLCARRVPDAPLAAPASLCRSVDVTDAGAVEDFADEVDRALGPIDLWINNAGLLGPVAPARDADPDEVRDALLVNVAGVIYGSAAFARRARCDWPSARRVLINISSGAATSIYEGWSTYGPTKAAVDHFSRILAAEEPDLVVHSVAPGVVDTPMQEQIRATPASDFPSLERFVELDRTSTWNSAAWIADHVAAIVADTLRPESVTYRIPNEPR